MLSVDFHCHTLFSKCGLHTIVEMLTEAKARGLSALAITDHGPRLESSTPSTFWDRLVAPVAGIRLLKGMECNVVSPDGEIDFPRKFLKFADIVLLGLHPHLPRGVSAAQNTGMLLAALEKNPFVDIVTHPEDVEYPVEFDALAAYAAQHGVALECNNSKILNNRVTAGRMLDLLQACKRAGCLIAVNSDAHAIGEVGCDESVRPLIEQAGIASDLIVNRTAEAALAFVEKRRGRKVSK